MVSPLPTVTPTLQRCLRAPFTFINLVIWCYLYIFEPGCYLKDGSNLNGWGLKDLGGSAGPLRTASVGDRRPSETGVRRRPASVGDRRPSETGLRLASATTNFMVPWSTSSGSFTSTESIDQGWGWDLQYLFM